MSHCQYCNILTVKYYFLDNIIDYKDIENENPKHIVKKKSNDLLLIYIIFVFVQILVYML